MGLRAADLDSVGRGYLDLWARSAAKVELMDAWFAEHGFLRADGEPAGAAKVYFVALNVARLNLDRLEQHVRERQRDPLADLDAYLVAKTKANGDDA